MTGYLSGKMSLPKIEQAWCDAAFYFHEGIAEPLDTIAVSKLETAIKMLLVTESSRGSKAILLQAMKTFFGLYETQPINPRLGHRGGVCNPSCSRPITHSSRNMVDAQQTHGA